jgi:Flp pilus assembly protein CpaB
MVDTLSPPPQIDESAAAPSGGDERLRRPVLRTHRGLPARRAIAGGVLVAAAALGLFTAFLRADSAGRDQLVVAAHALPAGTRLSASDLRLVPMRVPSPQRAHAFRSVDGLVGRLVVGPIGDGELVQAASVVGRDEQPPFRQLTVLVDASQLQAVDESDTVDILVTTGTGEAARTEVAAGGARILRISRRGGGVGADGKAPVTFALGSFDEVTRVVEASKAGALTLVRATGFAAQPPTYDPSRAQSADSRP